LGNIEKTKQQIQWQLGSHPTWCQQPGIARLSARDHSQAGLLITEAQYLS
jgi:hypothetical protein